MRQSKERWPLPSSNRRSVESLFWQVLRTLQSPDPGLPTDFIRMLKMAQMQGARHNRFEEIGSRFEEDFPLCPRTPYLDPRSSDATQQMSRFQHPDKKRSQPGSIGWLLFLGGKSMFAFDLPYSQVPCQKQKALRFSHKPKKQLVKYRMNFARPWLSRHAPVQILVPETGRFRDEPR
jgi:hypothetical protein